MHIMFKTRSDARKFAGKATNKAVKDLNSSNMGIESVNGLRWAVQISKGA